MYSACFNKIPTGAVKTGVEKLRLSQPLLTILFCRQPYGYFRALKITLKENSQKIGYI